MTKKLSLILTGGIQRSRFKRKTTGSKLSKGKACLKSRKLVLSEGESGGQEGKKPQKKICIHHYPRLRYEGNCQMEIGKNVL